MGRGLAPVSSGSKGWRALDSELQLSHIEVVDDLETDKHLRVQNTFRGFGWENWLGDLPFSSIFFSSMITLLVLAYWGGFGGYLSILGVENERKRTSVQYTTVSSVPGLLVSTRPTLF